MTRDAAALAVVLVDSSACRELIAIESVLVGALGTPTVRIAGQDLPSLRASIEPAGGVLDVDGRRVRPTVAWVRHASPHAISASVAGRSAARSLCVESWSNFLTQIAALAAVAIPGREPGHVAALRDAARLGVATPRTVVATGAGRDSAARLVVKALGPHFPGPSRDPTDGYFAQVVDPAGDLPEWADGRVPVLVQEYVEHVQEYRVYYLNGGVCAFAVDKPSPASIWTAPDRVRVSWAACPAGVEEVVRTLAARWRLTFGAFDLLMTASGEPVFLEVNTDGDWLWFEQKARWDGVTFMAAAMLRELHVRVVSAPAG
ncbi:hypothetical protein [Rugosimonospora acidiphila]|uniref:hypothetical protein n=1 Tax=Rugosimonospora acidiphila TaxID=556531 RepID=UPI0031EA82AB